jgi:hypothetical protein
MRSLRWQNIWPFLLLLAFALPVCINLAQVPVAWLDETMNLDPAVQWHLHGTFTSALWPNQGAEQKFMCYLPLVEWFHMLNLGFLPWEIFWVRLPFLLLFLAAAVCFYLLLAKVWKLHPAWSLLLLAMLLFDKAVFEILRSVRSETLELSLLAVWLFLNFKHPKHLAVPIIAGLLFMAHPKLWPAIGVGMLFQLPLWWGTFRFWLAPMLFAAPTMAYFLWLDAPMTAWWQQLQGQAAMHGASAHKLYDHFIARYWPYFKEQPWMPLLHACTWIPALRLARAYGRTLQAMPAWMWMAQDLTWLLILAPHHRYLPPHHLLMYVVWAQWLVWKQLPWKQQFRWAFLPVGLLLLLPYSGRMVFGLLQREERDPERVLQWLDGALPPGQPGKTLVIGHSIAHYYLLRHKDTNLHFALEIYPQKFRFRDYQRVFYLGHHGLSAPGIPYPLPEQKYGIPATWSATYRGLILSPVRTEAEMEALVGAYRIPYP